MAPVLHSARNGGLAVSFVWGPYGASSLPFASTRNATRKARRLADIPKRKLTHVPSSAGAPATVFANETASFTVFMHIIGMERPLRRKRAH